MALEDNASSEFNVSLASLLNILWRRRLIVVLLPLAGLVAGIVYSNVVTPLYLATATVRPGITAFAPNGGGVREWRLKDITHWYDARLYEEGLAERMGITRAEAPIINSHFILRGLQNIQGGNIITLTTLDPDPARAIRVLDTSIAAFADYAVADSLSNSIALATRGLRTQIAELRRQKRELDSREASLGSQLALAEAESLRIDAKVDQLQTSIDQIEVDNDRIDQEIQSKLALRGGIETRLQELNDALELAGRRAHLNDDAPNAPEGVRPQALLTETEVYRGLVVNAVTVQNRLAEIDDDVGNLRQKRAANGVKVAELKTQVSSEVALERAKITDKLQQLRLDRGPGLQSKRQALELQIEEKQNQLVMLAPIERVGSIVASEHPVRPRKKRAILILTFLGVLGGITLAFVWDYLVNNRREIFSNRSAAR